MPEMLVMAPTTSYCLAPSGAGSTWWYVSGGMSVMAAVCAVWGLKYQVTHGLSCHLSLWFDLMYVQKRRYGTRVDLVRAC